MAQIDAAAPPQHPAGAKTLEAPRKSFMFGSLRISLIFTLFLQRLGINAAFPFPFTLFVTPAVVAGLWARGIARISQTRVIMFGVVLLCVLASMAIADDEFSIFSGALFIGLYAIFVFRVDVDRDTYMSYIRMIANMAAIIAVIGVVQFLIQFVVPSSLWFSWRGIVPAGFLIEYNTLNMTRYASGIFKANGFFMLEPSVYSQLCARVLLLSIVILRDIRYLAPFGLALLVAYSGTGLVLFLVFGTPALAYLMLTKGNYKILLFVGAILAPVAIILLWDTLNLSVFADRLAEFGSGGTSAFARFVSGFFILDYIAGGEALYFFFGHGPGTFSNFFYVVNGAEAYGSGWIKLFVEYGFFGLVAFCVFFWTIARSATQSGYLATAFLFHFLFLDGGLLVPPQVYTAFLLYGLVCCKDELYPSRRKLRQRMWRSPPPAYGRAY